MRKSTLLAVIIACILINLLVALPAAAQEPLPAGAWKTLLIFTQDPAGTIQKYTAYGWVVQNVIAYRATTAIQFARWVPISAPTMLFWNYQQGACIRCVRN